LRAAVELAPRGLSIRIYHDLSTIPQFNEDLEYGGGAALEPVLRLRRAVVAADGLLIATPEYSNSIPGVLKNVLDWLSRSEPDEPLVGKPVAIVGATSGSWGTRYAQAALRQVLFATHSQVQARPGVYVRDAGTKFVEGRLIDESTRKILAEALADFAAWIEQTAPR
jgi:chromate reductase